MEYDANGNVISTCVYNEDGTINYQHKNEYNAEGDDITHYVYDGDGTIKVESHSVYTYYE